MMTLYVIIKTQNFFFSLLFMIRFNNSKNKKLLIHISNFIHLICGGDRLSRISKKITSITKNISKKYKKKIVILDFGCGSMEISKKLEKKSFVKKIIGTDVFNFKFKTKKNAIYAISKSF